MSITNLAALQTLNGQSIKTGKQVSFSKWKLTSVDALVAFLVKFNPGVESIDCSDNNITRESCTDFSRISTTHLISLCWFVCSIWLSELPKLPPTLEKLICHNNKIERKL